MRRHVAFDCSGETLVGTLDDAPGSTGLLLVSGGNAVRAGPFDGQAQLAARIAAAGFPVFRFDRRGVGDSTGPNAGFRSSAPDIAAALAAFRREAPQLGRVAGFGNCDAAAALMQQGGAGLDTLVLANPWTIEDDEDDLPPAAAIRSRYAEKLRNPRELARLFTGKVSLGKLAGGIGRALRPAAVDGTLARQLAEGLSRFGGPYRILLAERDRTAQAFLARWDAADPHMRLCPGASHAFVEAEARVWMLDEVLEVLRDEQARQLDMG